MVLSMGSAADAANVKPEVMAASNEGTGRYLICDVVCTRVSSTCLSSPITQIVCWEKGSPALIHYWQTLVPVVG